MEFISIRKYCKCMKIAANGATNKTLRYQTLLEFQEKSNKE